MLSLFKFFYQLIRIPKFFSDGQNEKVSLFPNRDLLWTFNPLVPSVLLYRAFGKKIEFNYGRDPKNNSYERRAY